MKEFNKDIKLKKLRLKNNKSKYIKYTSIILSSVILLVGIIYFTFAKFESNKSYTLIEGKIGDYTSGDINIAFNVDGNSSNTMPEKGTGYKYKRAECNDNNVEVTFDKNIWRATVSNISQKTKCTLYFETVSEVEVTLYGGVNEVITVDNEDQYTMDSTGKLENVTIPTGEVELTGSISNQTFTVNVDSEATEVYAMPNNGDGVIYWYGYMNNLVLGNSNNGWSYRDSRFSFYNPTFNANDITIYFPDTALRISGVASETMVTGSTFYALIGSTTGNTNGYIKLSNTKSQGGTSNASLVYTSNRDLGIETKMITLTDNNEHSGYFHVDMVRGSQAYNVIIYALWYE